ncbi:M14 family zinc carboxypeptidase [Clostridium sp. AM58-1XD]|uniref:M14 family zinc carboxypeptidase n=1 Tax=Clostridium sp. AM58-1XD TaxID=2292307 RepID=UPI000E4C60F4|nr:M14 family zinc carboxypeptidase [Clostridium sp. AM58-1XD]RGZ01858.1 peptidase [Clostridium sp. AM58-1XD]
MKHYRLTGILALSMGLSCLMPAVSLAEGPGDLIGQQEGTEVSQESEQPKDPNDISLKESSNPIVKVAGKYSYEQMAGDISRLQSRYGGRMRVGSFGTSLDGRALYEITIGNPGASKHVMIQAGIHGREHMTPLLVMKQLETALEFWDTANYEGQPISSMLDQVQVHFLPMVNPDGVSVSQQGLMGLHSYDLQQIIKEGHGKDMEESRTATPFELYLPYCKGNGRGVDLNVNFPAKWEQITTSPGHASYTGYKGEKPGSEPESAGLMKLADSRSWSASVSYHSRGEVIYWDFDGNKVKEQSRELAKVFAEQTGYQILGANGKGGFKDWMQIKENPVPSITVETGTAECPMPVSEWPRVWSKNRSGWAAALYYAWTHG